MNKTLSLAAFVFCAIASAACVVSLFTLPTFTVFVLMITNIWFAAWNWMSYKTAKE
jgi:hypothetical protein